MKRQSEVIKTEEPLIDVSPQEGKQQVIDETKFEKKGVLQKISHLIEEIVDVIGNHNIINDIIKKDIDNIKNDICKMADEMDKLKQADINLKYLIGKNGKKEVN